MQIFLRDECDPPVIGEDLYLETFARDTKQNIFNSIQYISSRNTPTAKSILIVTSPYHIKRCLLYAKQAQRDPSSEVSQVRIGAYCSKAKYARDNWFLSEAGFAIYFNEYWKIQGTRVIGDF
jgi:hypothetical protein